VGPGKIFGNPGVLKKGFSGSFGGVLGFPMGEVIQAFNLLKENVFMGKMKGILWGYRYWCKI